MEIATLVTDKDLTILAKGPCLVVHQPDSVLEAMDEWCTTHHGESGLTEKVRSSQLTLAQAEQETLAFVQAWVEQGASTVMW